jgi:hypothetical protein
LKKQKALSLQGFLLFIPLPATPACKIRMFYPRAENCRYPGPSNAISAIQHIRSYTLQLLSTRVTD